MLKTEADLSAFEEARKIQLAELLYYDGKKLKELVDVEEFLESCPDEVLNKILEALDEVSFRGIDIKKSLSQGSS